MRHSTTAPASERAPRHRGRVLAAIVTTALLAGGITTAIAAPASAAPTNISAGTGTGGWAVQPRWVQYVTTFGGTTTPTLPASCTPGSLGSALPAACAVPVTVSAGSYNAATGDASAQLSSIAFAVPAHGIQLTLSDVKVTINGATKTGTVSADLGGNDATLPQGAQNDFLLATIDLASATVTADSGSVSYSGIQGAVSANAGDYIASWSAYANTAIAPLAFTFAAPTIATTTAVAVGPTSPVILGASTTVTATVTASGSTPTGTIDLYDKRAGTTPTETLLAEDLPVTSGVATYTGVLPAGGHTFRAEFTGSGGSGFASSVLTTTANYGVVDVSSPVIGAPPTGSAVSEGVTASWAFSDYSNTTSAGPQWAKSVMSGDATISAAATRDFVFTNGTASYANGVFTAAFDATVRVTPNGMWLQFADPVLTIGADGRAVWTADLTTIAAPTADPVRTVIATATNVSIPDLTSDTAALTIPIDYFHNTAYGTWSAAYDSGWSNALLMQVPSSVRAYFYQSGALVGSDGVTPSLNASKPARPIVLGWSDVTTTSVSIDRPNAVIGDLVTATATVSGAVDGVSVEFADGDSIVATSSVVNGSASVSFVPSEGSHSIIARYRGDETSGASSSPAASTVVGKSATAVALASSASSIVSGTSATLAASVTGASYGSVTFVDGATVLGTAPVGSGGVATLATPTDLAVGSHSIVASFAGSVSAQASTSAPIVLVVSAPVAVSPPVATPAAGKVAAKVTVKAKTFTKNTKPKFTITVPKLSNGKYASGNVRIYVNGKSVKVMKLTTAKKGKLSVTLPRKYKKSIKVSVKYGGNSTVKSVSSTTVKLTAKK